MVGSAGQDGFLDGLETVRAKRYYDRRAGKGFQPLQDGETDRFRTLYIEDHHVGAQALGKGEQFVGILGAAENADPIDLRKERGQAVVYRAAVIGDEDTEENEVIGKGLHTHHGYKSRSPRIG